MAQPEEFNAEGIVVRTVLKNSVRLDERPSPVATEDLTTVSPTSIEQQSLRKVPGLIPLKIFLICLAEFTERASYFGAAAVFANFMQFPLPEGGNGAGAPPGGRISERPAGALGKGLQFASAFILLFLILSYIIPVPGAWLAEVKLGRFNTIFVGVVLSGLAHVIQVGGAAPALLQAGKGVAPFLAGFFLLAFGSGLIKPNVYPMMLDQYEPQPAFVKILKSGERVIVDPESTLNRITLIYYAFINVGAFFPIATTFAEKITGYWLAFLIAGIPYFVLTFMLAFTRGRLIKKKPDGSVLTNVCKIIFVAFRKGGVKFWTTAFWDSAKPTALAEAGCIGHVDGLSISWTDAQIDATRRTFAACTIFLYIPIWEINDAGVGNIRTNQGASMLTQGIPNDFLTFMNALTIIVTAPILSYIVYPALARRKIYIPPITKMTIGFALCALGGLFGAIAQWKVYELSPCGYNASTCDHPAPISIWWQLPNICLGAISECFVYATSYELAYAFAPEGMEALVLSVFMFSYALSFALGELLNLITKDPYLIWLWGAPAVALALQTVIFWLRYRSFNNETMFKKDRYQERSKRSSSVDA